MPEPVAVYREESGFGKCRVFEIHADHVSVSSTVFGRLTGVSRVPLKTLNPEPDRIFVKNPKIRTVFVISLYVMSAICLSVVFLPFQWIPVSQLPLFLLGVIFAAIVLLKTTPPVEYYQYFFESGVVALDIARIGKQEKEFESFTARISSQARQAKPAV